MGLFIVVMALIILVVVIVALIVSSNEVVIKTYFGKENSDLHKIHKRVEERVKHLTKKLGAAGSDLLPRLREIEFCHRKLCRQHVELDTSIKEVSPSLVGDGEKDTTTQERYGRLVEKRRTLRAVIESVEQALLRSYGAAALAVMPDSSDRDRTPIEEEIASIEDSIRRVSPDLMPLPEEQSSEIEIAPSEEEPLSAEDM